MDFIANQAINRAECETGRTLLGASAAQGDAAVLAEVRRRLMAVVAEVSILQAVVASLGASRSTVDLRHVGPMTASKAMPAFGSESAWLVFDWPRIEAEAAMLGMRSEAARLVAARADGRAEILRDAATWQAR